MDPSTKINIPISEKTVSKILEPALVPIGQAIGGIIQWVFQKPIEYGIVKNNDLNYLKAQSEYYLNQIPIENRTDKNLGLTLKAFEDSRYQLSNEIISDYFAKLIAGTVNIDKEVKPIYSSILSEMTDDDAKLLQYFFNKKYLFQNQITHSNPFYSDGRYKYFSKMKYYIISGIFEEGSHRTPELFADIFYNDVELTDIETSFLFLLSKGLISLDLAQSSHVLIYAVEKKSLNTDIWLKELIEKYSDVSYDRITEQKTGVYTLTSLGSSLADLVCHKD